MPTRTVDGAHSDLTIQCPREGAVTGGILLSGKSVVVDQRGK